MAYMVEDRNDEGIEKLNNALLQADLMLHPFLSSVLGNAAVTLASNLNGTRSQGATLESVPDSDEPVEVQKRREAEAAGKAFRVPEWWRGEDVNYKVAQTMMKTVPKDIGPLKK